MGNHWKQRDYYDVSVVTGEVMNIIKSVKVIIKHGYI